MLQSLAVTHCVEDPAKSTRLSAADKVCVVSSYLEVYRTVANQRWLLPGTSIIHSSIQLFLRHESQYNRMWLLPAQPASSWTSPILSPAAVFLPRHPSTHDTTTFISPATHTAYNRSARRSIPQFIRNPSPSVSGAINTQSSPVHKCTCNLSLHI